MPVPNTMADLSTLAGSNSPAGSEAIGNSLDNYMRAGFAITRSIYALAASTIASAATIDVAGASGESVQITGTITVTSLGTGYTGCYRELRFSGILILTNSANLKLGGSNITTAAGDVMSFRCTAAGVWELTALSRPSAIDGALFVLKAGDTMTGALTVNANIATSNGSFICDGPGAANAYQGASNVVLATTGADTVFLRPNGAASTTGEVSVASSGAVAAAGSITITTGVGSTQAFIGGSTVVLASTGANSVFLRPNGAASATGQAQVQSSGNFFIAGTGTGIDWVATSDESLKANIRPRVARAQLADALGFIAFDWAADGRPGIGVSAQQVRTVAPEYVHEGGDGMLAVDKASLSLEAVIGLAERVAKLEAR